MIAKKRLSIKSPAATPKRGGAFLSRPVKSSEKIRIPTSSVDARARAGHHACSQNDILCIRNKWNREEPRTVSPSNPIEQANGFCHHAYHASSVVNVRCSPSLPPSPRQTSFRGRKT